MKKMIKRAQWTFIIITMSILLFIFSGIFFGISVLFKIAHYEIIENTLDETFEAKSFSLEFASDKIVIVNGKVVSGQNMPYKAQILPLYNSAVKSGDNFGSVRIRPYNFCYKFYSYDNIDGGQNVFIAMDTSENLASLRKNRISTMLFLGLIYLGIFFIVWLSSFKVFKPIKNNFDKQKRFISDASHELKTPLTIISANADVLKQSGNYEENAQYLDNIKFQTERMDALVADMLSLAKMDEGRLSLADEPFNVSETVTECVLPFDALAFERGKNLNIDISPDVVCVGDRASVKKIASILVDNAIKYSDGEIKVSLKREGGKVVNLSVYNTGSTIPDKDSNKIFERFYSGENSHSRASSGSGLGLSIAKSIADANKWKIYAESVFGVSMTITVCIKIKG